MDRNRTNHEWSRVSPRYRRYWENRHGGSAPHTWSDVEPYWRYSYEMHAEPRYSKRPWNEVESELESNYASWAREHNYDHDQSMWEKVKDTIRHVWEGLVEGEAPERHVPKAGEAHSGYFFEPRDERSAPAHDHRWVGDRCEVCGIERAA